MSEDKEIDSISQKFGIALIFISVIFSLVVLVASDGWYVMYGENKIGLLPTIFSALTLSLEKGEGYDRVIFLEIKSAYILIFFGAVGFYGELVRRRIFAPRVNVLIKAKDGTKKQAPLHLISFVLFMCFLWALWIKF